MYVRQFMATILLPGWSLTHGHREPQMFIKDLSPDIVVHQDASIHGDVKVLHCEEPLYPAVTLIYSQPVVAPEVVPTDS